MTQPPQDKSKSAPARSSWFDGLSVLPADGWLASFFASPVGRMNEAFMKREMGSAPSSPPSLPASPPGAASEGSVPPKAELSGSWLNVMSVPQVDQSVLDPACAP